MHLCAKAIVAASIVLAASFSPTQQSSQSGGQQPDAQERRALDEQSRSESPKGEQPEHHLLAKISYNSGTASDHGVRQICFSVSQNGEYRVLASLSYGRIGVAHGTLPKEKFDELAKLISAPAFRNLTNDEPGLIRQDAEAFAAEIRWGKTYENGASEWLARPWRLHWLNPDGQRPFPAPVSNVVDWVKHLQPKVAEVSLNDAESAEYADVCPALGFRLLQPSLAER